MRSYFGQTFVLDRESSIKHLYFGRILDKALQLCILLLEGLDLKVPLKYLLLGTLGL